MQTQLVVSVAASARTPTTEFPLQKAIRVLGQLDLSQAPAESHALQDPLNVLCSLQALRNFADSHDVIANVYHCRIMLYETYLLNMLSSAFSARCHTILSQGRLTNTTKSTEDKLEHILWDTHAIVSKRQTMSLNPAKYFSNLLHTSSLYYPGGHMRYPISEQEVIEDTVAHTVSALRQWFDLPNTLAMRRRGAFVRLLCRNLGNGALYLPTVWRMYRESLHWATHPFKDEPRVPFDRTDGQVLSQLEDVLRSSWITSTDKDAIRTLGSAYSSLIEVVCVPSQPQHQARRLVDNGEAGGSGPVTRSGTSNASYNLGLHSNKSYLSSARCQ